MAEADDLRTKLATVKARASKLTEALTDLCDAWTIPGDISCRGGGRYDGNITKAYDAARAALAACSSVDFRE